MIQSLPSSTEVCIVGAGPSGLACAAGLAARKIPFVLVDALAEGHNSSRAVLMQASALEALEAIDSQLSDDIVAAGIQSKTFAAVDPQEKPVFSLRMTELAPYTKYAFSLLIQQHKVEQRMREFLYRGGNKVHWNKRVSNVKESADSSKYYELQFDSGEMLTARYVVAADGSKSVLRSLAGIRFINPYTKKEAGPGADDLSFVVADVLFSSPLPANIPRDGLQMKVGTGGVILTAPLLDPTPSADSHLFRLYIGVPDTPPRTPDAPYLQAILDARGPGSHSRQHAVPKIAKVLDSSRYVQRTEGGAYILLVGDAAHKHGPAGGQGMNMGICDGCELALAIHAHRNVSLGIVEEKTGAAIAKRDAAEIFDEYSKRRRAVARKVINMVRDMMEVETGGPGWFPYVRLIVVRILFKLPFFNGLIAWRLSGLGHAKKA